MDDINEEGSNGGDDSDFYSDEDLPQKKERKIIYEVEGEEEGEGRDRNDIQGHDQTGMALHNLLATPRQQPTPYDPPGYTPAVDKNRLLRSYRAVRDLLIYERGAHQRTRDNINRHLLKIKNCKSFGSEKIAKITEARKRQDERIYEWKELEKQMRRKKKEFHVDVSELMTELRQVQQDLEYEIALRDGERRVIDKREDEIVVVDGSLGVLVKELSIMSSENDFLHEAEEKMREALKSTAEIAEDGERRLEEVGEELGLTEVDVFTLQRRVKVAEEEVRKWRSRCMMVEKDVVRSEKLLRDFTASKGIELELQGANRGGDTRESVSAGKRRNRGRVGEAGLSALARGFEGIGGTSATSLMEAVLMPGGPRARKTIRTGDSGSIDFSKSRRNKFSNGTNSGEVVDGMKVEFSDTYHDIAVNNNRRGTAKARSMATVRDLWPSSIS